MCDCDCCRYVAAHGGAPYDPELTREYQLLELARIKKTIRSGRWRIQFVEPDGSGPAFAYTIGLWSHGHPELLVFGLAPSASGALLNLAGEQVVAGESIVDGASYDLSGWLVTAFAVPNPDDVLFQAGNYYRRSIEAVQLVYPDAHGTWPWEPGCHLMPGRQPMPGTFCA